MNIRDAIGRLNLIGGQRSLQKKLRELALGTISLGQKGQLEQALTGIAAVEARVLGEMETWIEPGDIGVSAGVDRFDVCDLRFWLEIADQAGVPYVPARPILSVPEVVLEELVEKMHVPPAVSSKLQSVLGKIIGDRPVDLPEEPKVLPEHVAQTLEQLSSVMEGIPASWMVRTHLCGSSNLKALVGTGVMLKGDDTARLNDQVKLGAGWVEIGNRRMIDFNDKRFIEIGAQGHKGVTHYLARPWAAPARFHDGEDLHRAGSPLAGPGKWPAEWRVFIRNGEVTGVANYYGWTGEGATPENAWMAIEAAALAQRMVDRMEQMGLLGVFMDTELFRDNIEEHDDVRIAFKDIDPSLNHATLDFIETTEGLKLLEGGPGHLPGGGAHPCAFAGQGVVKGDPGRSVCACEGVAYKNMPHTNLGDPRTWVDGDPEGSIDTWMAAADLALQHKPFTKEGQDFIAWKIGFDGLEDQDPSPVFP